MGQSHLNAVPADDGIDLGIIAPDGREGMQQHAQQFAEHGIPFIFDLGQAMPLFNGDELLWFIARATYVTLNDYEGRVVVERTRLSLPELAQRVKALVVTRGAEGSEIYLGGTSLHVPVAQRAPCRRPDRLRRCLPRRTAVWHRARSGLGDDWPAGRRTWRDQDRGQRRAELCG